MGPLKTVRLAVHPGKHSTSWALVLRTDDGRTVFDRRLHAGVLSHIGVLQGVSDLSGVLRQIADEVDRRHGVTPAPPVREPRGAVGGGEERTRTSEHWDEPCPLCGHPVDGAPPEG